MGLAHIMSGADGGRNWRLSSKPPVWKPCILVDTGMDTDRLDTLPWSNRSYCSLITQIWAIAHHKPRQFWQNESITTSKARYLAGNAYMLGQFCPGLSKISGYWLFILPAIVMEVYTPPKCERPLWPYPSWSCSGLADVLRMKHYKFLLSPLT